MVKRNSMFCKFNDVLYIQVPLITRAFGIHVFTHLRFYFSNLSSISTLRRCSAGPLNCARSFADSPKYFGYGDNKLMLPMAYY